MNNKHQTETKKTGKKNKTTIVLATLAVLGVGALIGGGSYNLQASDSLSDAKEHYAFEDERTRSDIAKLKNVQYIVDNTGKPDKELRRVNLHLKTVFKTALTFEDGESYTKNREEVLRLVEDKNFFEKFLPVDKDKTGHSQIDAKQLKMRFDKINVYEVGNDQYYITVSYIPYKKEDNLQQKDSLVRDNMAFKAHIVTTENRVLIKKIRAVDSSFNWIYQ